MRLSKLPKQRPTILWNSGMGLTTNPLGLLKEKEPMLSAGLDSHIAVGTKKRDGEGVNVHFAYLSHFHEKRKEGGENHGQDEENRGGCSGTTQAF